MSVNSRSASARTTAGARLSVAAKAHSSMRGGASCQVRSPDTACSRLVRSLDEEFDRLVEAALCNIRVFNCEPDPAIGLFTELYSVCHAVTLREGRLLESGLARIAALNPDLELIHLDAGLPIVPSAYDLLENNSRQVLEGLRLPSAVYYKKTYKPDLLLINKSRDTALMIDVKRSLSTLSPFAVRQLQTRMAAAALSVGDWLYRNCGGVHVKHVEFAIVHGADEALVADHKGIYRLAEVDGLLDIPGAAGAINILRQRFAQRVQEVLSELCRAALGKLDEPDAMDLHEPDVALKAIASVTDHDSGNVTDNAAPAASTAFMSRGVTIGFAKGSQSAR